MVIAAVLLLAGGVGVVMLAPHPAQAQGQASTPLAATTCDCQETTFGDLATDAIRSAGGANIALMGAISFRADALQPGPITLEDVSRLLANPNEIWVVSQLKGSQIRQALEHSVRTAPLPNNSFLQVSGLTVAYSASGPRGQRLQSVLVGEKALDDTGTYTVAMPLSLAKGGSGFFQFFSGDNITNKSGGTLGQAIVQYAAANSPVSYAAPKRIIAKP